ncbi:YciI family protein [Catenuloplanes japonicus]|uniref:YciI family protein n=1 Tax=Catenuloplanes japonicus TaxID=33876 RepID=UPI00052731B7|nr:YciI family protein [Catenuloplanes japonicus]
MQFMTMLKMREDAGPPPPDFYEAMGAYIAGVAASGRLITTGGLLPSSAGVEVRATTGGIVVTHGPFTEATELIGGYAVFKVGSRDEAIAMATEFVQLHVDHWPGWEGASEIRQIAEPPPR